jgi:CDP-glucose 4,6-dehydratase
MGLTQAQVTPEFWNQKKVFVTGHTGFKGSWLCLWLQEMGAVVMGYSLEPDTQPSLFNEAKVGETMVSEIGDVRDLEHIKNSMVDFNPDILLHLAAQPLVRKSYQDPVETYSTNVMGTVNVLEAARKTPSLKSVVVVTTDKCYENKEWEWGYRENEPMGGHDPYSSSKGCAELVTSAYIRSFFNIPNSAAVASARAGNVIGGGDWADDRLVPDILSAFAKAEPVIIRNPLSTRPWQHVLEPLSGYLVLAEALYHHSHTYEGGWNFGPKDEDCRSVGDILDTMTSLWGEGASWELDKNNNPHEAGFLKLDCSKSKSKLNWQPKWNLDQTLEKIIEWHKGFDNQEDVKAMCLREIREYTNTI